MNCAITAGARVDGEFASRIGTSVKALARIGGRTMLELAIEAARTAGAERVAVVGGDEVRERARDLADRIINEGDGVANVRNALRAWGAESPLLYLTSDMPFITGAAVRAFVDAVPANTLAMPLTGCGEFEARFPGAPPFGVSIGGELVVNGGAFWIPSGSVDRIEAAALRFFEARKSMARMALLLGPVLSLQFALRRLSIGAIERRAQQVLKIPALAVRGSAAELAYDVDTLAEYEYAQRAA